jgi:hypothetical protein
MAGLAADDRDFFRVVLAVIDQRIVVTVAMLRDALCDKRLRGKSVTCATFVATIPLKMLVRSLLKRTMTRFAADDRDLLISLSVLYQRIVVPILVDRAGAFDECFGRMSASGAVPTASAFKVAIWRLFEIV